MSLDQALLLLHPSDNVAVTRTVLAAGQTLNVPGGTTVTISEGIPANHKVAVRNIAPGEAILKYGQRIGLAAAPIAAGAWVHVHNVAASERETSYEYCTEINDPPKPTDERTFMGFRRHDGQAGTRNYVALISTVNCSATTARYVAQNLPSLI